MSTGLHGVELHTNKALPPSAAYLINGGVCQLDTLLIYIVL